MIKSKLNHLVTNFFIIGSSFAITISSAHAKVVSLMQYNVENLFDTIDDPNKSDDEFTPDGSKNWTPEKLALKIAQLAKVITAVKNPDGSVCPDVVTFTEIENPAVLQMLNHEGLKACKYTTMVVDKNDPDPRGIRVALMSRLPLLSQPISHPSYPGGRYIQETHLKLADSDLTIFVNHWKSRLPAPGTNDNGAAKRAFSAGIVTKRLAEIFAQDNEADFVVMGDLNDEFEDSSISKTVMAKASAQEVVDNTEQPLLWETSFDLLSNSAVKNAGSDSDAQKIFRMLRASFYYAPAKEKAYQQFDHILISRGLFNEQSLHYVPNSFHVVRTPVNTNPKTKGPLPFKVGQGADGTMQAIGASDHFPVLVELETATAQ